MPRDGSGVFSLPVSYLAIAGQTIQPNQHNPPLEDLAAALTDSISRTGVTPITADIPFGGFKATGLGNATAGTDAVNLQTADARYDRPGGTLSVSTASGAMTISLLTEDGSTPSASSPVGLKFRSTTETDGSLTLLNVTSALTLVITSGSTLGVPAINTPFSLYVGVFNDAGVPRLGVVNRLSAATILELIPRTIANATAEGGSGGADSAQVFYSDASLSAKAFTVVGRLDWSSGLGSVGTWTNPSKVTAGEDIGYLESNRAPMPRLTSGVGQVVPVFEPIGSGYIFPAGGYWIFRGNTFSSTNTFSGNVVAVIGAGGTVALGSPGGADRWVGFAERVA